MRARVRLLRHHGVLLQGKAGAERWLEEGLLESEHGTGGGLHRLVLRYVMSAPGHGVIAALYSPTVVRVDGATLHLRGLERVSTENGDVAGVAQEWLISLPPADALPPGAAYYLASRGELPLPELSAVRA
jgi:hypothetical protein